MSIKFKSVRLSARNKVSGSYNYVILIAFKTAQMQVQTEQIFIKYKQCLFQV